MSGTALLRPPTPTWCSMNIYAAALADGHTPSNESISPSTFAEGVTADGIFDLLGMRTSGRYESKSQMYSHVGLTKQESKRLLLLMEGDIFDLEVPGSEE
ncbi:hypothetical protein JTB14_008541 [Gonioctena quinquepunctata]|nr:hypothetical protein JTB14_008541 [Gonioctena quinquepunctata]